MTSLGSFGHAGQNVHCGLPISELHAVGGVEFYLVPLKEFNWKQLYLLCPLDVGNNLL